MKEKSSIQVLKEYTQKAFEVLGTDKGKKEVELRIEEEIKEGF